MITRKLVLLAFLMNTAACASLIQSTSLADAYKAYEREDFERTLELISRSENIADPSREMKAELTYLKANAHERLGEEAVANTLYAYLAAEHGDSQYGYLASEKLEPSR
ncbi:MAG: hypothetical protein AAF933_13090 [Pseudomonadota bacterium]